MLINEEKIDIVCVGDLMIEYFLHLSSLPKIDTTIIIDSVTPEVGGPAFNISWYLANLKRRPLLVSSYGANNKEFVAEAFLKSKLDNSGLVMSDGETDILIDIFARQQKRSMYLRSSVTDKIGQEILVRCGSPRMLVITGSRHSNIRKKLVKLADEFCGELLAFNPSYAIYEYEREEFISLVNKAHVTIFNKQEASHACKLVGVRNYSQLSKIFHGIVIVTLGNKGVTLYKQEEKLQCCSYADQSANAVGAGDAFLAGFLHKKFDGVSLDEAVQFGSIMASYVVGSRQVRVHVSEAQITQEMDSINSEQRATKE